MSTRAQTAENRDIRAWARANGIDLGSRGRIPQELRASYHLDNGAPSGAPDEAADADDGALASTIDPGDGPEQSIRTAPPVLDGITIDAPSERAPIDPKRKKLWQRSPSAGGVRRRESLSTLATFAWGGLAQMAERAGRAPTARMLALQAPIAGTLVDDALRGTLLDRVLQPLARTGKKGETLFALVAPPILVEMIAQHPERAPMLLPILASALESYAEIAGPKLTAAKKRAEKRAQELGAGGIEDLMNWVLYGAGPSAQGGAGGEGGRSAA
jgi:hypothetical protein